MTQVIIFFGHKLLSMGVSELSMLKA